MVNLFGLVEYMGIIDAREGLKKNFEVMSNDINLFSLENKRPDD